MTTAKTLLGALCCLGFISTTPVFGDTVSYTVAINTTSLLTTPNTTGYIDLQLDPGSLGAAGVTATISGYVGASLATVTNTSTTNLYASVGQVSTSPASSPILLSPTNSLIMMNGDPLNELAQGVTFNSGLIAFVVTFSGPGVSLAGKATSLSGTNFILDFLNTSQSAYLLTNDPNGNSTSTTDPLWAAGVFDIGNNGLVTAFQNPGPNGGPSAVTFGLVPEPSTWFLLGGGLLGLTLVRRVWQRV